jgi:SAM-dependent methyltransferase
LYAGYIRSVVQEVWDRLFDELYLRTYAARVDDERTEREALGAVVLAGVRAGADVLDAACGYGRHALVLGREGYRVTGIDRSPVLLAEAQRRSGDAEWPRWVRGDLREPLPFAHAEFDAVLTLFSSFVGYYAEEDDVRFLGEARRVLRPGGALVLETMSRDRLMSGFRPKDWERVPDGVVVEERTFDPVDGVVETLLELWPEGGGTESLRYRLRTYTATELRGLARRAGFEALAFYDSLEGGEPGPASRIVLVARA